MQTVSDLVQHCSPENVEVMSWDFDTVYKGPASNVPSDLLPEDFADAYYDKYSKNKLLQVRTVYGTGHYCPRYFR